MYSIITVNTFTILFRVHGEDSVEIRSIQNMEGTYLAADDFADNFTRINARDLTGTQFACILRNILDA